MTIIFPCDCGSCYECSAREWFRIESHPRYTKQPLIVSRHVKKLFDSWVDSWAYKQEHLKTAEEAFAHNSLPLSVTNESHDQKKSRLKREHDTRMREAFLYGRQR